MISPPEKFKEHNGILSTFLRVSTFLERKAIMHLVRWTLVVKRTLALTYWY